MCSITLQKTTMVHTTDMHVLKRNAQHSSLIGPLLLGLLFVFFLFIIICLEHVLSVRFSQQETLPDLSTDFGEVPSASKAGRQLMLGKLDA